MCVSTELQRALMIDVSISLCILNKDLPQLRFCFSSRTASEVSWGETFRAHAV